MLEKQDSMLEKQDSMSTKKVVVRKKGSNVEKKMFPSFWRMGTLASCSENELVAELWACYGGAIGFLGHTEASFTISCSIHRMYFGDGCLRATRADLAILSQPFPPLRKYRAALFF